MSDTTDNRPEGNDRSDRVEPSPQHENITPAAQTPPASTPRSDAGLGGTYAGLSLWGGENASSVS
ncbi:hypothetical protein ACTHQ7_11690, partial [Microbacterium enclense]